MLVKQIRSNKGGGSRIPHLLCMLMAFIATSSILSCGGGGGAGIDRVSPTVAQISPSADASDVPATTSVSVKFSEDVALGTLNATTFTVAAPAGLVSGSVVCTASTATFFPDVPLKYDTIYTATLTTGVQDLAGNSLGSEYSWDFTTVVAGPGDTENYLPLSQGSTWTFQGTITQSSGIIPPLNYTNTLSVDGTVDVNGKTTTVFIESHPENSSYSVAAFVYKDLNGITYYGSNDPLDTITPLIVPYQEINFPAKVGYSYVQTHKTGIDVGADIDNDGINETADVLSRVTVIGFDTVTVPAGIFANCIQLETDALITIKTSWNKSEYSSRGIVNKWYAPGVGPVKMTSVLEGVDGNRKTVEEVLNGRFVSFAKDLAVANSDTESPGKPSVAYDGTNFLVVTRRVASLYNSTLIGLLITEDGEVLNEFDIADTGASRTDVAFGNNNYLVVFGKNGQIAGQRVAPDGQVLDGLLGFAVTSTGSNYEPVLAFDGVNFMAVWRKYINGGTEIYGAIISPDGQVLQEFPVFTGPGVQMTPTIAFDGDNYLVAWTDTLIGSNPSSESDVYATRITPDGVILDPSALPICTADGSQGGTRLIFDGNNYFAVWGDGRISPSAIYGARISKDGIVLDAGGFPINTETHIKSNLTIAFNGNNYFVGWQTGSFANYPPAGIYGTWVSTAGEVLNTNIGVDGLSISGPPPRYARYYYPVAKFGTSNTLVTWINLTELGGTTKDIRGAFLPSP